MYLKKIKWHPTKQNQLLFLPTSLFKQLLSFPKKATAYTICSFKKPAMNCYQNLTSFIPALLLAAFFLTIVPSHGIPRENLVTICSKTSNLSLCQKILSNDSRTMSADLPMLSLISSNREIQANIQKAHQFSQQKIFRDNGPLVASKRLVIRCSQAIRINSLHIEVMNKLMILCLLCFLRVSNISCQVTMAFSAYSSQLPTLFLILLIVHPALGDPATQQRIDRICRQNEDYGFCNRTFNENLRGPADYVGLTLIANDQVLRNTTNTYQFIVELQASTTDPATGAALETCRIGCSQVRQAFMQAISYFNQRDYANMVEVERAAPRGEAFCRPPMPESPLVERKRELRILIAMAVVTGHILAT